LFGGGKQQKRGKRDSTLLIGDASQTILHQKSNGGEGLRKGRRQKSKPEKKAATACSAYCRACQRSKNKWRKNNNIGIFYLDERGNRRSEKKKKEKEATGQEGLSPKAVKREYEESRKLKTETL